jgi:hypothetical protein
LNVQAVYFFCSAAAVAAAVQSWNDLAADLVRKVPSKIDIGPVYTHDPRQRAKYAKGAPAAAAASGDAVLAA